MDSDKKFAKEWNERFTDDFVDKTDIENSLSEKKVREHISYKGLN